MGLPKKAEPSGLNRYREQLEEIENLGLRRRLQEIQSPQGRTIQVEGKNFLNFSSNNYLGLAEDPRVRDACVQGLNQFGVGAGASRLVNGSLSPFHHLEKALADFKGTEAALVFNSGYHANVGALSSLVGRGDVIFSDELNHASMIDGILLSKAKRVIYAHNDPDDLRAKLEEIKTDLPSGAQVLLATESIFSMEGDVCRLGEFLDLAEEYDALLYLDEAHGTGVFGDQGAGLAEGLRSHPAYGSRLLQMGTLGKALGCFGAYVAGSQVLVDFLMNRARTFIFTTALPPALASGALEALRIVQEEKTRRETLWQRIKLFETELASLLPELSVRVISPIIPIIVGAEERALDLSEYLRDRGFWVNAIRPPTVPPGTSRLRVTVMATHREDDVRGLVGAVKDGLAR